MNGLEGRRSRLSRVARFALRTTGIAVIAIGLGALGTLAGVPWLVERGLDRYAESGPERSAGAARVYFNPLTLDVVLEGIEMSDPRAGTWFSAGFIRLDFSAASVLERRPVLDVVVIERPVLRAGLLQVGALLHEMQALRARVERLELLAGSVEPIDAAGSARLELALGDVSVTATSFDFQADEAQADANRYTVHATTAGGGEIDLEGAFDRALQRARGEISVRDLDLGTIQPFFGTRLAALGPRGRVNWTGEYALASLLTMPELELLGGRTEVMDFALSPVPGITVSASELSGTANGTLSRERGAVTPQGRIDIADAALEVVDNRLTPPESFAFSEVAVAIAADPGAPLTIDIEGRLGEPGDTSLSMGVPPDRDAVATFTIEFTDIPAAVLSPYSEQSIGRSLDDGRADVALNYAWGTERVDGDLRVTTRGLSLSAVDPELASATDRSLELAAALLEDAQGIIQIDAPFTARAGNVRGVAANALEARLAALAAAPFDELGAIVGRDPDELRAVPFEAGSAALGPDSLDAIDALAAALRERPRLGLRLPTGFDPVIDRNALARQQIELHVLLATAGPSAQPRPQAVDFASPRAQGVLDEFANERLTPAQLESVEGRFECGTDATCNSGYYAAMFDALVTYEPIPDPALTRLGRFRAQSIIEELTGRGIEPERVGLATDIREADLLSVAIPIGISVSRSD